MIESIGPYQVLRELGRGGMGVVYLARDARLERDVAIKALPEELAQDPVRLERFEREAKSMASLNHPNVAGIHGIEEQNGSRYLVLEFVDGESLADRLDHGPFPIDEAIHLATQIAAGIEAAHEAGVIHRDLKPANIMITPEGIAKVLDFGLARADDGQSTTSVQLDAATLTKHNPQHSPTIAGAILGTAPYMSPEQARGRRVDKRADVWAFGVLLYEMLVGSNPFKGETATDSIGAVIHKDIDLSKLPNGTPSNVHHVLTRCLERDKSKRFRDIGDVRIELEHGSGESLAAVNTGQRSPFVLIALAAFVFVISVAGTAWFLKPGPNPTLMNLAIPVADRFESIDQIALSPDGETIAMIAKEHPTDKGTPPYAVYVRSWSDENFRKLQGTDRAKNTNSDDIDFKMTFSPSGEHLLIEIEDEIRPISEVRSIPIADGPSTKLFEILQKDSYSNIFCYLSDDAIVVFSRDMSKLYRISTSGGAPEATVPLSGFEGWEATQLVQSAPGSQTLIATFRNMKTDQSSLFMVDLETGKNDLFLDDASDATILTDGHIIFEREHAIWMAPFNIDNARATGPAKGIFSGISNFAMEPSARRAIYLAQDNSENRVAVVAADVAGRPVNTLVDMPGRLDEWSKVALSPDGHRLLFNYNNQNTNDLWVHDMTSGLTRPFSAKGDKIYEPSWTPDGRIAYHHLRTQQIMVMDAVPGATPSQLLPGGGPVDSEDQSFTPDGRHVLIATASEQGEPGIYLYDVGEGDSGRSFYASPSNEGNPAFNPDGRWVAYTANGSGQSEIYLRPFDPENPESTPIYPVTKLGGDSPKWSTDGQTLYYFGINADEHTLFAVTIETEPELKVTQRRTISTDMAGVVDFVPMPDGSFILLKSTGNAVYQIPDLRVVLNWELN
jgi:eukaryotic-like serine/threonine-protein kinase